MPARKSASLGGSKPKSQPKGKKPQSKPKVPRKDTKGKGKATGAAPKQRGPKTTIQDPHGAGGDDEDDDEALAAALEAEEMVAGDESEDEDDEESEGEEAAENVKAGKKARSAKLPAASASSMGFLANLDKAAVSQSRAELARISNIEKRAQRAELKANQKEHKENANDSDSASTDMAGLSDREDDFDDEELDDFDSEAGLSDMDDMSDDGAAELEEMDDEEKEEVYAQRMTVKQKRKAAEEAREADKAKRKRLPVMTDKGWEEGSEVEDDENSDAEAQLFQAQRDSRAVHEPLGDCSDDDDDEETPEQRAKREAQEKRVPSTITTGARFGMQAPYVIMSLPKRSQRVIAAREQIARLATDVVGDPEVGLGLLRRLAVFAAEKVQPPEHDRNAPPAAPGEVRKSKPIDEPIRAAAIMSLCAVFIDVLPGYRIKPLTDAQKAERVNQETARRREWEQGLVEVYRSYLELCDKVLRAKTTLSPISLRAMCLLLTRAMHFNYRTNLIRSVVSQLSRRTWSDESQLCADSLVEILYADASGEVSLEVVRLLHRMIKERSYKVHAIVLDILLHLRLKDELGARRGDTTTVIDEEAEKEKAARERERKRLIGKGKAKPGQVRKGLGAHLSKKQVKHMREVKEVEEELKEADAVVDAEEKAKNQSETLKLLFVLYFSILKTPTVPGALLASALEGLARFAHRINVDFFRDLLNVLRQHVRLARNRATEAKSGDDGAKDSARQGYRQALLCIVTAFELLSGQGEALNIDLSDMMNQLYAIMLPLSSSMFLEEVPEIGLGSAKAAVNPRNPRLRKSLHDTHLLRTDADLLLRALELAILRPRASSLSSERTAAIVKRCLTCALQVPPKTAIRLLGVVRTAIGRDARLEALLDTEDRAKDGAFDAEGEDVDSARPLGAGEAAWELHALEHHIHADVAAEARRVRVWRK